MKKLWLATLIGLLMITTGFAQKYAYVDTEYILDNIPEYKDAQIQLDDLAAEYQQEIEEKLAEINQMYKNFQAEAVLMPDDVKERKKEDIRKQEQALKDLQNQRFGPEGDLFLKREELVKPIQEKIFNAIEEIAVDENFAFVFDRAGSLTILYVNARFDISDDVLDKVGAELGTVRREDRVRKEYTPSQSNQNKGTAPPRGPGSNSPGPVRGNDRK